VALEADNNGTFVGGSEVLLQAVMGQQLLPNGSADVAGEGGRRRDGKADVDHISNVLREPAPTRRRTIGRITVTHNIARVHICKINTVNIGGRKIGRRR
jgi:hypothetical protein